MKKRKLLMIIILAIIVGITTHYIKNKNHYDNFTGPQYGVHEGIGFDSRYNFLKSMGENIIYDVKNIGKGDITVKIDKMHETTLKPGQETTLSCKLSRRKEVLRFTANSKNDKVNINYNIIQK